MDEKPSRHWENLTTEYMVYIEKHSLRDSKYYRSSMNALVAFAESKGYAEYTPEIGLEFYTFETQQGYRGYTTISRRRSMLKRLNEHLYGCTFWHRANFGRQYKRQQPQCPDQFSEQFEEFLKSLKKEGMKDVTIKMYRALLTRVLCEFAEQGVVSWGDLVAKHLTVAYISSSNKYHFVPYARRFFGYLTKAGLITHDYSGILPPVTKPKNIPSVYTQAEVQQLLNSISTNTPVGKRDYAIVMLISGLGIRASDISLLGFENMDFTRLTIGFTQYKTGVPQRLKLPIDVAKAVRDYIDYGREESEESFIFLNGSSKPLTIDDASSIVQRRFKESGIEYGHRHHGANALRSSYASQLIEGNVPYEAVRVLMGHTNRETTRHYVDFSIESLRRCALDVPLPSGHFKSYLESEVDVEYAYFEISPFE